jgi:hypothetical protein
VSTLARMAHTYWFKYMLRIRQPNGLDFSTGAVDLNQRYAPYIGCRRDSAVFIPIGGPQAHELRTARETGPPRRLWRLRWSRGAAAAGEAPGAVEERWCASGRAGYVR